MHGRSDVGIAQAGKTLHVEPWRAKCAFTAEADSRNSELRHNVVSEAVLRSTMHRQPRNSNAGHVHDSGTNDAIPADGAVLGHVVVNGAEPRQILRHETPLTAKRIARDRKSTRLNSSHLVI